MLKSIIGNFKSIIGSGLARVLVHSPVEDHQIDQRHYHTGSEPEKWQKREGHQASIEENIQTPVRTWIGLRNHKNGPKPKKTHVLDLVLTNEKNIVKSIKYSSGLGLSDHLCLLFHVLQ